MNGINSLREFGEFVLDTERRVLWYRNEPVNLQLKEIELLAVLTEQGGEVVTKEVLLDRVWADSFVEESNLSRHVYRIRKAFQELGVSEELIQTVPRRGYRFTGAISCSAATVFERHSLKRTLIEEIEDGSEAGSKPLSGVLLIGKSWPLGVPGLLLLVLVCTSFGWYLLGRARNSVADLPVRSIAVLPLKTLGSTDDDALGIGFADALITSLGKLDDVKTISTNAVSRYSNLPIEPLKIGRQLNVDAVMEGTLQRANGKFRVTLRLLRVSDGKQMWTGTFNESENRIFELQDAMSMQTAKILSLSFETGGSVQRPTSDIEAYNFFLQGEYFFRRREISIAGANFKRAIEIDPRFADAWAGLAAVYAMGDAMDEAEPAVDKALELNPDLAHAHAVRGFIKMFLDWDWEAAEDSLDRAVELGSNSVEAHHWRGIYMALRGRFADAKAEMNRALELDPLSANMISDLGQIHYFAYDFETAEALYLKANSISEGIADPRLVDLYERQGKDQKAFEAQSEVECRGLASNEESRCLEELGSLYRSSGAKAVALKYYRLFRSRVKDKDLPKEQVANAWYGLAVQHRRLGQKQQAISSLQETLERKTRFEIINFTFPFISVDPQFDELRSDPVFQQILRRTRL
ncbi:MAG: winged helix-turn-helix domain-containing protein [Acidobacteriota bacterium]|nr:MAG: winged helix-turn-helix domain-containing protein [Acidobacteriota bacterium]